MREWTVSLGLLFFLGVTPVRTFAESAIPPIEGPVESPDSDRNPTQAAAMGGSSEEAIEKSGKLTVLLMLTGISLTVGVFYVGSVLQARRRDRENRHLPF